MNKKEAFNNLVAVIAEETKHWLTLSLMATSNFISTLAPMYSIEYA